MSTFDNPFDPARNLRSGCPCGQHASASEHDASLMQCVAAADEAKRYEGVVASAVMRAVFPQEVARRAFLKSVGAPAAPGVLSQFFPIKMATEVFAQGA
ncbi:MAG: nitrate ABC transporter substrate-binding protein, partial [Tardiphaga sp.]|nr:nitrate ABC transporter substrate-binding protein [Tardiphaga sp.]